MKFVPAETVPPISKGHAKTNSSFTVGVMALEQAMLLLTGPVLPLLRVQVWSTTEELLFPVTFTASQSISDAFSYKLLQVTASTPPAGTTAL